MSDWAEALARALARHATPWTAEQWLLRKAQHPATGFEPLVVKLWEDAWALALHNARTFNSRELLVALLDTGRPVPADVARQLLDLKGPPNRSKAVKQTPEQVALLVRLAALAGFPQTPSAKQPDRPSAFAAVADLLHCKESTVRAYWRECPPELRAVLMQKDADSLTPRFFENK